ncbi:MAG: DPP IV N-terminal domain-containing protein [Bacteroidetes bacterium]|nr:DPP IV N-terminal domain-containing protein [Bacteroidota bacterium]
MKKITILLLVGLWVISAFAQNKELSIDEAVLKGRTTLAPERLAQLQWIPNTNTFSYIGKKNGYEILLVVNTSNLKRDTALTIEEFNSSYFNITADSKKIERFPAITWESKSSFRYTYENAIYQFDVSKKQSILLVKAPKEAEDLEYEPKTKRLAYTLNNNLFYADEATTKANNTKDSNKDYGFSKEDMLTHDGNYEMVYGKAVHRNEFGIVKGTFWSPTGNKLAYYQMNQSAVADYTINHNESNENTRKTATAEKIKYPMAGTANHVVKLFFYDFEKKRTLEVKTENNVDQYLTNIAWSPDEEYIYIAIINRNQWEMKLNMYDGKTGAFIKTVFKEQNEKYVEPEKPIYFMKDNPKSFLWLSERDGYNQLYLYNRSGEMVKQLTHGNKPISDYLGTDAKGNVAYYMAFSENGLDKHLDIHIFSISSRDNTTKLNCRTILPYNFDSTKKYPVLVYVYGGPHAQMITNSWLAGADLWLYYMAQKGYIIFTMDNRGSSNRGFEFESATYRKFGEVEMQDQLAGVDYLIKQKYVDANRIGVYGWSFGGFMTTSLMTRSPGVYKVGVAGGPVIDWRMYEIMYTERYMDTPKENPEGYKTADLTNYVKNLNGKLLLIHGTSDNVVLWQHTLTYLQKCIDEGVLVDYFVYPGHEHNVLGKDRVHLMKKITQYFKENL